jgi:hypothetical protein
LATDASGRHTTRLWQNEAERHEAYHRDAVS